MIPTFSRYHPSRIYVLIQHITRTCYCISLIWQNVSPFSAEALLYFSFIFFFFLLFCSYGICVSRMGISKQATSVWGPASVGSEDKSKSPYTSNDTITPKCDLKDFTSIFGSGYAGPKHPPPPIMRSPDTQPAAAAPPSPVSKKESLPDRLSQPGLPRFEQASA